MVSKFIICLTAKVKKSPTKNTAALLLPSKIGYG